MDTNKISRSALKQELRKAGWVICGPDGEMGSLEELINDIPPAPDWTPCSEKQPESDGVYYVTVTFNGKSVTRDQVFHEGRWLPLGKLMVNGVSGEPEVIAWMEKPAPYQAPVLVLGRGM